MPNPDFGRLAKTVMRQEPDRVPLIEVLVEYPVMSQFLGRNVSADDVSSQVDFWLQAGYDYVPVTIGMMTPGKVTDGSSISRVIRENLAGNGDEKSWNLEYTSFINDRGDFEKFPWHIASQIDMSAFHKIAAILPEGMKIVVLSGKIFTLSTMLMGFENYAVSLIADETLVADVMSKVAEIQMGAVAQILGDPAVGAVWAVDDIACHSGTMISPAALRTHLFPYYRQLAGQCHRSGKLFFYHSDGDLRPVMDDLIDLGVDALHPIDPTSLDIAEIKRDYGDRICLFGNVSTELLRSGTSDEVADTVRDLLRRVAPGGGYAVGSGNSVPEWAKIENYNAMRETVLRYGAYPLA